MTKQSTVSADWKLFVSVGPCVAFHTACIIKHKLYIHGGLISAQNKIPVSNLYWLDLQTRIWNESQAVDSPCLSHHSSVTLQDRYMLLIGGWNGKSRTSCIHCFDTETCQWKKVESAGYPKEAGLSSHTAIVCDDGSILVIGREGSLHSHRRHSSAHKLTGNINQGKWQYKILSKEMDSRSGHTCSGSGQSVYLIGGRDDKLVEKLDGINTLPQITYNTARKLEAICKDLPPLNKLPSGRKNHIASGGYGFIVIHGGETFDGRNKQPVGEIYLLSTKKEMEFFRIGISSVARAGHICCCYGDKVLIHGGISGKENFVKGDTYELEFF